MKDWDPSSFDGQVLLVQINGNNLRNFLRFWDEKEEIFIGSPENAASVRVLTIHKSKGLEFPYVIFPFAEKVDLYKSGTHWSRLDAARTPLGAELSGIYPVPLGTLAGESLFEDAVLRERRLQLVDNINLFYVALTRAGKCLHIIAKQPTKKCRDSLKKGPVQYGNFSEILFAFLGGQETFEAGKAYDFARMERKVEQREEDFPAAYPSIPLGGRLAPSQDAHDFFNEDGTVGAGSSPRLRGIVLHDILSEVVLSSDLDRSVDAAIRDGRLTKEEGEKTREILREGIAQHPDWFPAALDGIEICNETDLFDADGKVERPDRVILRGRMATIVDYKFGGELESYRHQLKRYARLYRDLGYEVTGTFIWYVEEDKVVPV